MDTVTLWRRRRRNRLLRRLAVASIGAAAGYAWWSGGLGTITGIGRDVAGLIAAGDARGGTTTARRDGGKVVAATTPDMASDATPAGAELRCLAQAIYHDGAGQPREARIAIAHVARNRATSGDFVRNYCKVIYTGIGRSNGCLFVEACDKVGAMPAGDPAWVEALALALEVYNGVAQPPAHVALATHFHATDVKPVWRSAKPLRELGQVGRFIFHADNTGDTALPVPVPTAEVTPLPAAKPRSPGGAKTTGTAKPAASGSNGGESSSTASRSVHSTIERSSP